MLYYLIYLGIAFLLSNLLLSPFQSAAKYYEIVSPINTSKLSRSYRIPYLGGGALYFSFVLTLLFFFYWKVADPEFAITLERYKFLSILVGAALIAFAGLIKDIYPYPKTIYIAVVAVGGFLLAVSGIKSDIYFLSVPITLGEETIVDIGNILATILWTILVISVLDFCDVLDGAVSGISIVIGCFLFLISIYTQNYANALLSIVLTGVALGMFVDHLIPSRILLGKMGTGFIGFIIAAITLDINYSSNNALGIIAPLLLITAPLLYVLFPFFDQLRGKAKKFSPEGALDKLTQAGVKENAILFYTLALSCVLGFIAFLMVFIDSSSLAVVLLLGSLGIVALFLSRSFQRIDTASS